MTGNRTNANEIITYQSALEWVYKKYYATTKKPEKSTQACSHNIKVIEEALSYLSPEDYGSWINIGHALKYDGLPFEVWDKWSCQSNKYVPGECEEKWGTFKPDGRVNVEVVFNWAAEKGFVIPNLYEDWTLPEDLTDELLPVVPLPAELIPDGLSGWVGDIAYRMQVPLSFCAIGAIVVAGSIIGTACGIKPKEKDDWLVVPNLWGGIIAQPGKLKSPALEAIIKPLAKLEAEAMALYQLDLADYESKRLEYENRKSVLEKMAKEAIAHEKKATK